MPAWQFQEAGTASNTLLGADNSNNAQATTNVVSNADGSVVERIEYVQTTQAVPTADAATDTLMRDVVGRKTDAGVVAVGTTKTLMAYLKGLITNTIVPTVDSTDDIAINNSVGRKTDAAVTAVGTTKSILAYVKGLVTMATVQTANSSNNAFAGDVIGNKTDAAVLAPTTTKSLVGYLKGLMNSTTRTIEKTDGAVLTGKDPLFTITGGPIRVKSLIGIVTTAVGGVANGNLGADVTEPAVTVALSTTVAIDSDAAGTMYHFVGATGVLTPVTNGAAILDMGSATVAQAEWIVPIGNIHFEGSAAQTGVIKWYMTYEPLSPSAVVTAAA